MPFFEFYQPRCHQLLNITSFCFFLLLNITNFRFFSANLQIFLTFIFINQIFPAPGFRKPPLGFDKNLLKNCMGHGIVFIFLISQILAIFQRNLLFLWSFLKFLLNFAIVLKFLNIFVLFLLTIINSQRNFLGLEEGLHDRTPERKNVLNICFTSKSAKFSFCTFQFFLNDLFTNKARKLEVAKSNLIIENISSSLSVGICPSLSRSLFLSHALVLKFTKKWTPLPQRSAQARIWVPQLPPFCLVNLTSI